jgi:hypothetical protein
MLKGNGPFDRQCQVRGIRQELAGVVGARLAGTLRVEFGAYEFVDHVPQLSLAARLPSAADRYGVMCESGQGAAGAQRPPRGVGQPVGAPLDLASAETTLV